MTRALGLTMYRLKQLTYVRAVGLGVFILVGLQLANVVLLQLLGLPDVASPISFIHVIAYGFYLSTLIAFLAVAFPMTALYGWLRGGVVRVVSRQLLRGWVAFVFMSWLGFYGFILWDGLNITPYPWMIVATAIRLPAGSELLTHLTLCLLGSYCLLVIILSARAFSDKGRAEKVFGKAHFASAFELERAGLFSKTGVVLGKAFGKRLRIPGYEGVLVVAPTGSGKTTAIAIPNLLEWQGSGVFNDLKGELYQKTAKYREKVLHNACYRWSPACRMGETACYNPFFYVRSDLDYRIRDLQFIAETLIPETKLGEGFWHLSSRELFLTLSLYLLETTGTATLGEIHDLSKLPKFFAWLEYEILANDEVFSKALKQNARSILNTPKDTRSNILKDFHSRVGLFSDPIVNYATNKNDFDFRELRRKKMSLYIQIPDGDKARLAPILTLFWAQLLDVMSSHEPGDDEPHGVLALMDEFGNMARINKLKDGMSFLRSYHIRSIVIVQYLAQIKSVYGEHDAKGFLNSKIKIAFALNDLDDAQFFSKSLGTKTVSVNSSSTNSGAGDRAGSSSRSTSYRSRALLSPDELMQLSHKKEIILVEAKNPVKANKCYWFKEVDYCLTLNNLD